MKNSAAKPIKVVVYRSEIIYIQVNHWPAFPRVALIRRWTIWARWNWEQSHCFNYLFPTTNCYKSTRISICIYLHEFAKSQGLNILITPETLTKTKIRKIIGLGFQQNHLNRNKKNKIPDFRPRRSAILQRNQHGVWAIECLGQTCILPS